MAGSISIAPVRFSRLARMLASVMRFMCGQRLQGRTKCVLGLEAATLSLIEHSVSRRTEAGFSRVT